MAGREVFRAGLRDGVIGVAWRTVLGLAIAVTAGWGYHLLALNASGWHSWIRYVALIGGIAGAMGYVALVGGGRMGGTPPTGTTGQDGAAPSGAAPTGTARTGTSSGSTASQDGGQGGPGGSASTNSELTDLLNQTSSRWSAAVIGDQTAAGYILNSDTAVMSIGGWSGSDNNVTLEQFKAYVASGDISYFISGGGMGGGPGGNSGSASEITEWVTANFSSTTVGSATVYDLTSEK
ncbi:hypothetical protein AAEX63_07700 [Luteococcus sp. H138]|uniref:hypothetical protein n=1 Tax=unclassified Luteococcus TaxID=2639923 RepID=UPI00313D01A8